jgi:putative transposase
MVEDMLAARGIIVTHQTIRSWAEKFGRHFAREIKRRSAGCLGRQMLGWTAPERHRNVPE